MGGGEGRYGGRGKLRAAENICGVDGSLHFVDLDDLAEDNETYVVVG